MTAFPKPEPVPRFGSRDERNRTYARLRKEYREANKFCLRCRRPAFITVHHTRGRLGPLLNDQRYWQPICPKCHTWINWHPAEARAKGFLCQVGEWGKFDP